MNPAVGIDLGTTNTVVGYQTDDNGPDFLRVPQPVDRRNELDEGQTWIKSAVYFESAGAAVVGAYAAGRQEALRSVKSRMGTRWQHRLDGSEKVVTAPYVSAHVLGLAHKALGLQFPDWDRTALITVPALFNSAQRSHTLQAARLAGFKDVELLDEPTAAFYYHFNTLRDTDSFDRKQTVLVFDFGGGTLDVSVIEVERAEAEMHIDVIGRSRYNNLGGDDIDYDLAAALLACWRLKEGRDFKRDIKPLLPLFVARASRYKEFVEDALREGRPELLDFRIEEDVGFGKERIRIQFARTLTRAQYEEITGHYFAEKSGLNIYRPISEALAVARRIRPGFTKEHLNLVLYTGGASRMAAAQAALAAYFPESPCLPISNEQACHTVALGAAACRYDALHRRQAVRMTKRLLEIVFTCTGEAGEYVPLIPLDTEPSETFRPVDQEFRTPRRLVRLVLPLFRGVSKDDQQMVPVDDLEIDVGRVLDAGIPYRIEYRVTADLEVLFRVVFDTPQGPLTRDAAVDMDLDGEAAAALPDLAAINAL
jgi:molecular chaperone DnaK